MSTAFIVGYLFGFVGAIPAAGPVSMLVLSRALQRKYREALTIATGASVVEATLAGALFWGLGEWLSTNEWFQAWGSWIAALVLIVVGVACLRTTGLGTVVQSGQQSDRVRKRHLALGVVVTALNPTLLATWTTAIAMLASTGWMSMQADLAPWFGTGAFAGMVSWFIILVGLVRRFGSRLPPSALRMTLRSLGAALIIAALVFAFRGSAVLFD